MKHSKQDFALLILRIGLASVFVYRGNLRGLGLPYPYIAAAIAASSELLGGLSLLSGARTRYLLAPLSATMLVATIVNSRTGFNNLHGGAEFPLLCLCSVLAIWLAGPGGLSITAPVSTKEGTP